MNYFFCKRDDMWLDSWTYGDWRQYVCKRPDGALQCARMSELPAMLAAIGFLLIACVLFLVGVEVALSYNRLIWARVLIFLLIGVAMVAPTVMPGRCLMVAVGPKQRDGVRVFAHELEDKP